MTFGNSNRMMNTTAWIKRKHLLPITVALTSLLLLLLVFRRLPSLQGNRDRIVTETFTVQNGWGYEVIVNGKTYIHQPFVPGNNLAPFPSEKAARKAARLVENKIKAGLTPNLTREELEKAGAFAPSP